MDITAGSGGVSAEDEDGGRQDDWLGTTLEPFQEPFDTEAVTASRFPRLPRGPWEAVVSGRGSSGGSSAFPNETLAAADKEPPSSNEASSAGDAKKNKRIRFDKARGGHLTLLLDVTTGSGGGGGCERIVKLRPGGTSEPYVGNKPLASMVISGEVSVSDSAISGQAAANLKASISVLQQLCSWKKSDLQKFTDGACGALKYKVDKINAHAKLLSLSPSLLFFCVTSDDLNASVMYEDSSADGAFKSLVLSEFGEDRASSHIFVSVASSDTGESSAFESLSKSLKPDSRLQATYIKELVKAAASLCEVNGVKFSLLCQDPGSSPAWIQAFGEWPDSGSKGPFQRHFPRSGGSCCIRGISSCGSCERSHVFQLPFRHNKSQPPFVFFAVDPLFGRRQPSGEVGGTFTFVTSRSSCGECRDLFPQTRAPACCAFFVTLCVYHPFS